MEKNNMLILNNNSLAPSFEGELEGYTAICASAGVGTSKSRKVGYLCTVSAECLFSRCRLHKALHPEAVVIGGDFTKKIDEIARAHIAKGNKGLVITLPCQSFSLAGGRHLDDPLTWLFLDAVKLIKRILELGGMVNWVIWENAPYFIQDNQDSIITDRLNGRTIFQYIRDELAPLGLISEAQKLNACNYGTAQSRLRGYILCKRGNAWQWPTPDDKILTCRDVIGDRSKFPRLDSEHRRDPNNEFHRIPWISPVQEAFIRLVPTGEAAIKYFLKMGWSRSMIVNPDGSPSQAQHENSFSGRNAWDKPIHTITQGSDCICGDWTLHPGEWIGKDALGRDIYSDPRPFSVAEIFALTGLDDEFTSKIPLWARPNDKLLREICGEALLPNMLNRLLQALKL